MNNSTKTNVKNAAGQWMVEKEVNASQLAKLSGVNPSYLSAMLNGKTAADAGDGKLVDIADKWWILLADAVGLSLEKKYWKTVETRQMRDIMFAMETAREHHRMTVIVCPTGMGKTYCIPKFRNLYPKDVIVITISSLVRLHDIINMLCEALNIPLKFGKAMRMAQILIKLRERRWAGGCPTIIFDEAENMEHSVLKMMKGLFDGLIGDAAIVLIGTDQLETKMLKAKNANMDGGPQFWRRFKAGINRVSTVVEFDRFFEAFGVDKGVRKVLERMCENYGELHDYLEPALREADVQGVPLTESFFRMINP